MDFPKYRNMIDGFEFNADYHERDRLMKITVDWANRLFDIQHFHGLCSDQLYSLVANNHIYMEEHHNGAPTVGELYALSKVYPSLMMEGYVVSPFREDYRVSIDGVKIIKTPETDVWVKSFRKDNVPDIIEDYLEYFYLWWD